MGEDDFAYEEMLGRGAFGEVWLARDQHQRVFAVKFFSGENFDLRDRIALEHANALIRVNHPGVVRVFGISRLTHPDRESPQIAIVMEYLDGPPLSKFMGELTLNRAATFATQLAEGLHAMHQVGVAHDDLHSGNVIVSTSSAKLVDPLYTRSLADLGPMTRVKTETDDVRALAAVIRELLEKVPLLDPQRVADAHYRAARDASSPLEALRLFAHLWADETLSGVPAHQPDPRIEFQGSEVFLAIARIDEWGMAHQTSVIDASGLRATLPGFFVCAGGHILEMRPASRTISLIREEIIDDLRGADREPVASDFVRFELSAPVLRPIAGGPAIELTDADPVAGERVDLCQLIRLVGVQGKIGPFLFIEQAEQRYAGGAHPDVTYTQRIVDLDSGSSGHSLLTEQESAQLLEREGRAAQALIALRDDERLFDDIQVTLDALIPAVAMRGRPRLSLTALFTAATSFAQSDHRWSSYTLSEVVPTRRFPAKLQEHESVPGHLVEIMRQQAGVFAGWSRIAVEHPETSALLEVIATRSIPATGGSRSVDSLLQSHARWRGNLTPGPPGND